MLTMQRWVHRLAPEAPQLCSADGINYHAWVTICAFLPTMKWSCVRSYLVGGWINNNIPFLVWPLRFSAVVCTVQVSLKDAPCPADEPQIKKKKKKKRKEKKRRSFDDILLDKSKCLEFHPGVWPSSPPTSYASFQQTLCRISNAVYLTGLFSRRRLVVLAGMGYFDASF